MTRIVSPEEFFAAFDAVVRVRKFRVASLFWDNPKFTRLMLAERRGILHEVANSLGLQYCREYWTIDAIMCEKTDTDNFSPEQYFMAEQLTVAIEHENNIKSAHQEMNKLSMYNSPLKVLITYPDSDGATVGAYLGMYADILRRADVHNDFRTRRRHLAIFGFKPGRDVRWESYVYRLGKFAPLVVKP